MTETFLRVKMTHFTTNQRHTTVQRLLFLPPCQEKRSYTQ